MFWWILLWVYVGFTALSLFLFVLESADVCSRFHQLYPKASVPKRKVALKLFIAISRLSLTCMIPILHILLIWYLLAHWEDTIRKTLDSVKEEFIADGGTLGEA